MFGTYTIIIVMQDTYNVAIDLHEQVFNVGTWWLGGMGGECNY